MNEIFELHGETIANIAGALIVIGACAALAASNGMLNTFIQTVIDSIC